MTQIDSTAARNKATQVEPLLRWAGGKRFLVKHLKKYLPSDLECRTYREPFLGSASLFFSSNVGDAFLSDANLHLILCYKYVRDYPQLLARYLREHGRRDCESYYYEVRQVYNRLSFSVAQAARFVYLNRTCFNGIFRVNHRGEFNVPYGWKQRPIFPDRDWLMQASSALQNAHLQAQPFEQALMSACPGDFVYLDPPYPPLNGTSNFNRYTSERFSEEDQRRLAAIVRDLDSKGCLIMMSNADIPLIRDLYSGFNIFAIAVTRYITCKSRKHQVSELIITNYDSEITTRY